MKAERLTAVDVDVTANPNGTITVAAMVGGYREARTYYFSTREEAVNDFLFEMNEDATA